MSLLNPIRFENPGMSDEEIEMIEIFREADKVYSQLLDNPGKWALIGEANITAKGKAATDEDWLTAQVYNALAGALYSDYYEHSKYATQGGIRSWYKRCDTKFIEKGNTKLYYAKYRKMFH